MESVHFDRRGAEVPFLTPEEPAIDDSSAAAAAVRPADVIGPPPEETLGDVADAAGD